MNGILAQLLLTSLQGFYPLNLEKYSDFGITCFPKGKQAVLLNYLITFILMSGIYSLIRMNTLTNAVTQMRSIVKNQSGMNVFQKKNIYNNSWLRPNSCQNVFIINTKKNKITVIKNNSDQWVSSTHMWLVRLSDYAASCNPLQLNIYNIKNHLWSLFWNISSLAQCLIFSCPL